MKIVCTALVLMLVASYGCTTDSLVEENDTAQTVITVEDVVVEDQSDLLQLQDVAAEESEALDVGETSAGDSLVRLNMEEVFTVDEDAAIESLGSDPTSFFTPAFRYAPSEPF